MIALKIAAYLSSLLFGTAFGAPALLHGSIGGHGSSIGSIGSHGTIGTISSHGSIGGSIGGISSHGSIGGIGSIGGGSIGGGSIVSHGSIEGGHGGYEDYSPQPFHFAYGVNDDYTHTDFSEQRSGDIAGNIEGEYTVALPDGRIQHVTYHADGGYGGTVMEVTYKGEAHHPEAIHGGHGGLVGGHGGIVGGHGGLIGRL